jgi:hypothetical protein
MKGNNRDTPLHQAMLAEYERYRLAVGYQRFRDSDIEPDVRPLARAVGNLMKSGDFTRGDVGPCLAVVWHGVFDFEGKGWFLRMVARLMLGIAKLRFWRAAMWNDFEMGRWQLSRDPRYIGSLYEHLKRGNLVQKGTGEWMVNSVCGDDAEFAEHWHDLERERGPVFNGDRERWLHSEGAR